MDFTDRTTGLSSITTLVVNDSFTVRKIIAEETETQNLTVVNPIIINGLSSNENVSIASGKNLTVGGSTTTNGLTSNEDVSIGTGKNLTVGGSTTTNGLSSNENVSIASGKNLTVGGTTTTNGLTSNENVSIATGKNLTVGGSTTTNGLTSNENVSIATGKNLTIGGNVTIQGTMTIPNLSQTSNQVAIGNAAGLTNQGTHSIAIGTNAGNANQPNGSIVINASGEILNGIEQNACYIRPVRSVTTGTGQTGHLYYSTSTRECTTSSNIRQFDVSAAIASGSNCIGEVQGNSANASGQSSGVNISLCSITLTAGVWQVWAKCSTVGGTAASAFTVSVSPLGSNLPGGTNSAQSCFGNGFSDMRFMSVPILYRVAEGTTQVFSPVINITSPSGTNFSVFQNIQAIRFA